MPRNYENVIVGVLWSNLYNSFFALIRDHLNLDS